MVYPFGDGFVKNVVVTGEDNGGGERQDSSPL